MNDDMREPTLRAKVRIFRDPSRTNCSLYEELRACGQLGLLQRFEDNFAKMKPGDLGDCHHVTIALVADLVHAARADGWVWAQGFARLAPASDPVLHSWVEYDGWVLDASRGHMLVMSLKSYYRDATPTEVTKRNGAETMAWLEAKRARGDTSVR